MPKGNNKHFKRNKESSNAKSEDKTSIVATEKSSATEAKPTPTLTVLRLQPKNDSSSSWRPTPPT